MIILTNGPTSFFVSPQQSQAAKPPLSTTIPPLSTADFVAQISGCLTTQFVLHLWNGTVHEPFVHNSGCQVQHVSTAVTPLPQCFVGHRSYQQTHNPGKLRTTSVCHHPCFVPLFGEASQRHQSCIATGGFRSLLSTGGPWKNLGKWRSPTMSSIKTRYLNTQSTGFNYGGVSAFWVIPQNTVFHRIRRK